MGLIHAMLTAGGTVLADQWKEYFYCDAMPADVLVCKGQKKTGKHSSNTHGSDNIITDGSGIAVNEGQCMIIVDDGQVVEICSVPGKYTYDMSTEPSVFTDGLGAGIKESFKKWWERVGYGGDTGHDQRIYYFNTKEIMDNKFGTQNPVPFMIKNAEAGRTFTVGVRCNGVYSYKITDPMMFFANVCGNVQSAYTRDMIDSQLKSEFLTYMQPAFSKLADMGIEYRQLPGHTVEICEAMNEALKSKWKDQRGIQLITVAVNSVTISKEDEDRIKKYEDLAWNKNPGNAAATMVGAQAAAMEAAAGNAGGAINGFFGMGMAQQAGGMNANELFAMNAANPGAASAPAASSAPSSDSWVCSCGTANTGKFCMNCGSPKPVFSADGWTCSCGTLNKGKFCSECGKAKPAGTPTYKCDKCGWEPADPFNPPKFCAECGDPFNDADIVK